MRENTDQNNSKYRHFLRSAGGQYSLNNNIKFKTPLLRSNLCDYSDAYIVVKGEITVKGDGNANRRNKKLTFKNAPFRSCI